MINNISGVVIAGGLSKRFKGVTKANIIIDGNTIISRILFAIRELFDEIIIVTNTPEEFSSLEDVIFVRDHFLNSGPMGGIHAALKATTKNAIFVFAGDMPLISNEMVKRQIACYNDRNTKLLVPRVGNLIEPLHSVFCTSLLEEVERFLSMNSDKAVRDFFKLVDVSYMDLEDSVEIRNTFININSYSDKAEVEKLLLAR